MTEVGADVIKELETVQEIDKAMLDLFTARRKLIPFEKIDANAPNYHDQRKVYDILKKSPEIGQNLQEPFPKVHELFAHIKESFGGTTANNEKILQLLSQITQPLSQEASN